MIDVPHCVFEVERVKVAAQVSHFVKSVSFKYSQLVIDVPHCVFEVERVKVAAQVSHFVKSLNLRLFMNFR